MPDAEEGIDFSQLIQQLDDALISETDRPVVQSGEFPAESLNEFITDWSIPRDDMPWCLWEQVDQIVLEKKTVPSTLDLLEYGRVFGEGGDLSFSRDGERFIWHFVGRKHTVATPQLAASTAPNISRLRQWEEKVLLWGEKHPTENRWLEDRVARARLIYPELQSPRVKIRYRIYTNGGQIQWVWLLGLEGSSP